ncbi:MAG: aldo/keto reductase [Anaerolineae bacterium]
MNAQERVQVGRTAVTVSRLSLGTVPLGNLYEEVSDADAQAVVDACWNHGIRFYDTAPVYGFGIAEQRLGRALAARPRGEYTLATKVGRLLRCDAPFDASMAPDGVPFFKGTPPVNPVFDFSYDGVVRSLEESLERLRLGRVDIVHIHDPDDHFPEALEGAYRALDDLRSQGVIGAVSVGMSQSAMLARFARESDCDCFLLAGRYTLLDQSGLDELLPLCAEKHISILMGGVYNSGILADPERTAFYNYVPAAPSLVERALRIKAVCERHGVPLKAAALQFPLGHSAVASVITGVRSVQEIDENAALFAVEIPDDMWEELRAEKLLPEAIPVPARRVSQT